MDPPPPFPPIALGLHCHHIKVAPFPDDGMPVLQYVSPAFSLAVSPLRTHRFVSKGVLSNIPAGTEVRPVSDRNLVHRGPKPQVFVVAHNKTEPRFRVDRGIRRLDQGEVTINTYVD